MVSADRSFADGTSFAWALPAGLVLAVLVFFAVRVVPPGERLVVFRFGRPVSVRRPGLAAVLPGVHRGVRVSLEATYADVMWLDAVTRDDVRVVINGAALAAVRDPVSYASHQGSPGTATVQAAEEEIRGYVAERDLAELAEPPEQDLRNLSAAISRRTRAWGVDVAFVEFSRVQVRLETGLIRWAEGFAGRAGPRAGTRRRTAPAAKGEGSST